MTNETKHMPTPLYAEKEITHTAIMTPLTRVGTIWKDEDATFIVRACNAHDELIATLQSWFDAFDGFNVEQLMKRCDPATLNRVEATRKCLAKARGEQ